MSRCAAQFLEVCKDKLTVRYSGKGNHAHDVGSIQADRPLPRTVLLYYFEILVADCGERGCITIGLAGADFRLNCQPGAEQSSYGYCGENGLAYHESPRGVAYGPGFGTDDVVGCGVNFATSEVFFTLNGEQLGVAFSGLAPGELYPTVGLHSPHEEVVLNFGASPFSFDVESLAAELRRSHELAVAATPVETTAAAVLVEDFLRHYGYRDTLAAFRKQRAAREGVAPPPPAASAAASADAAEVANPLEPREEGEAGDATQLQLRSELRSQLLRGDAEGALASLQQRCPALLPASPSVRLRLHCQVFVERIRAGRALEAMEYARSNLRPMDGVGAAPAETALQTEALGLLAYQDPASSPAAHLLEPALREACADALNAALLSSLSPAEDRAPKPGSGAGDEPGGGEGAGAERAALEVLARQLTACMGALREEVQDGRGEPFSLLGSHPPPSAGGGAELRRARGSGVEGQCAAPAVGETAGSAGGAPPEGGKEDEEKAASERR